MATFIYRVNDNTTITGVTIGQGFSGTLTIPSTVKYIASDAFSNLSSITSLDLTVATSLDWIGDRAFDRCTGLTTLNFTGATALTEIGVRAFSRCTGLTSVNFTGATTLMSINNYAFTGCTSLTTLNFTGATALTDIGGNAFKDCTSLPNSLYIPSSVTNISGAFDARITIIRTANSNTCFVAGTPVNTDQGLIPIEQLDHTVNTIDGQPIVAITKITSTDTYLISIPKDHLGPNMPSQEITISQLHKVLYNGVMTRAKELPRVSKVNYDGQPLYNVLLDAYGTMTVNNLTVETLHPTNNVAVLYKHITTNNLNGLERNKLIQAFNTRLALGDDLRKAFFENIVLVIMLDVLLEPKCNVKVTPYSLLKAFVPQYWPIKVVEQPLAIC